MSLHKIALLWGCVLAACHLSASATEPSAPWPQRPITMIVPFVTGGATDVVARLLSPKLSAITGQAVIVENVVGASGAVGTRKLVQSAPDGHVLMYGGISETVLTPLSNKSAGYRPDALQAVAIMGTTPLVMATRKKLPASSLDSMVKLARSSPMKYTYGSSGAGTYGHLMLEALARKQGLQLLHVPYKGSSQMLTDLASGHIDLALTSLPSALPYTLANKIDLLAVSTSQRLPDWPRLPTFAESAAWPQEHISIWGGVFAPRGLPPQTALKINAAFTQALQDEALRTTLAKLGVVLDEPRSPNESQAFYEQQVRLYQALATAP